MEAAPIPSDELERLEALQDYRVLDTVAEEAYDNLTLLASEVCGVPIALVSLVDEDRQWFKSHHGLDAEETPREVAFCAHAILQDEIFEVRDSHADPRFADNPLVTEAPHIRFYAGAILKTPGGQNVGTLCVIDHEPRQLDDFQRRTLRIIAGQVIALLELRKALRLKTALQAESDRNLAALERRNEQATRFAYRSSHDLRAPAIQIKNLARLTLDDLDDAAPDVVGEQLHMIEAAGDQLLAFIDGTVEISRAELMSGAIQRIDFQRLADEAIAQVRSEFGLRDIEIRLDIDNDVSVHSEFLRLRHLLSQLVSNSVKYANRERDEGAYVLVRVAADNIGARLCVEDNGIGIPAEHQPRFFDLYQRFHPDVAPGSGVGTAIVRRHAEAIGASVSVDSDDTGTRVRVLVPDCEVEVAM